MARSAQGRAAGGGEALRAGPCGPAETVDPTASSPIAPRARARSPARAWEAMALRPLAGGGRARGALGDPDRPRAVGGVAGDGDLGGAVREGVGLAEAERR